ncbi:MAG: endonuclease III [Bacilli bacterium]
MKKNILLINNYLDELIPNPICELNYQKAYELVIAVMLSAQTTDKGVNKVTSILFQKYNSLEKLASSNIEDIKEIIKPIGNYNKKANNIIEISKILINKYNKQVPKTYEELEVLPGIGRKSANVIRSEIYKIPSFAVDTHVIRVTNRLGLVKTKDPVIIEKELEKIFKKSDWIRKHQQLVLFGRYYCKAKNPDCQNCKLLNICLKKD